MVQYVYIRLLIKCEVKMAGCCVFLDQDMIKVHRHSEKRMRPISHHPDHTSLVKITSTKKRQQGPFACWVHDSPDLEKSSATTETVKVLTTRIAEIRPQFYLDDDSKE